MTLRCDRCPADPETPCLATLDADRFAYFCDLARSGEPNKIRVVVNRARIGLVPDQGVPSTVARQAPTTRDIVFTEAQLLVLDCDYRTRTDEGCGCGSLDRCGLARGSDARDPHAVAYADCRRCVQTVATQGLVSLEGEILRAHARP